MSSMQKAKSGQSGINFRGVSQKFGQHDAWKDSEQVDLTDFWKKVQELDANIAEQEVKKKEMGMKYDEEIRLINSNLGINTASTGMKCPKCGAMVKDRDRFCQNCGTAI